MFGVVLGSTASSELAAAIVPEVLLLFCDLPVSDVLLHNRVREHVCATLSIWRGKGLSTHAEAFGAPPKMSALLDAQLLAEEKNRGLCLPRLETRPFTPLPKMLAYGATTAVYLMHSLYERYDNCYMPRSALKKQVFKDCSRKSVYGTCCRSGIDSRVWTYSTAAESLQGPRSNCSRPKATAL